MLVTIQTTASVISRLHFIQCVCPSDDTPSQVALYSVEAGAPRLLPPDSMNKYFVRWSPMGVICCWWRTRRTMGPDYMSSPSMGLLRDLFLPKAHFRTCRNLPQWHQGGNAGRRKYDLCI